MTALADYNGKCKVANLERDARGVLTVRLHSNGGSLRFGSDYLEPYQISDLLGDIADDPENTVIVLTGTGESFCEGVIDGLQAAHGNPLAWDRVMRARRRMLRNLLDIEIPIVAAVNGPAKVHSEVALLCDIVIASDTATFEDAPHFPLGGTPGDGAHIIWPHLIGPIRAKFMLLTGQRLSATESLELGVVNEVVPGEQLFARAMELAQMIADRPPLSVRYTKQVMNLELKRLFERNLGYGLALEGLAAVQIRGWRMMNGGAVPGEEEWGDPEWTKRPLES